MRIVHRSINQESRMMRPAVTVIALYSVQTLPLLRTERRSLKLHALAATVASAAAVGALFLHS
jgi:hypothetical protein